ncbi:lipopolysaccharide assembly protein LapB [Nostoc sp. PCC 7107]|uniref:tetratricopeptide repeat protein n=1 Tax=Nostoc sp. PCC 7107 TaxID=317936 RepID=UPI00029EEDD7|nr:hypothetical protein [Nostoc sp. PCC 7107]AFY42764.1 Tetratricopeptide TPR_1 repeat-containing protein [Nostoc sp. PCC 7107]
MDTESEIRLKHFTALKSKYQATNYQDTSPASLLYLILRKANLGIELTDLEFDWLKKQALFQTVETIYQQQQSNLDELKKLENEFSYLKSQYQVPNNSRAFQNICTTLYPILWKLHSEKALTDSELEWLKNNQLGATISLAHKMKLEKHFLTLKEKYQATKYQGLSPDSPLYKILNKLENKQTINNLELEWLQKRELFEAVKIFEQQEAEKQTKFVQLKINYRADKYIDVSLSSPLYSILQKLDSDEQLSDSELKWLEKKGLTETITIAQELEKIREFTNLKLKYKAHQYEDSSPKSHLYKILKSLEGEHKLGEQDINFLKKRKLIETIQIANEQYISILKSKIHLEELPNDLDIEWLKNNGREDIIVLAQQKHYAILKRKYGLIEPNLPMQPFYEIMLKLEKKERLDIVLVTQLIEQNMLSREGKIATAHYRLEAEFYEQEIMRTGNNWNIPNASSYWRKANEPEQALRVTDLDLNKVKENKLKSAILVTRGGAFRDMNNLDKAEKCAKKAIDFHSDSYQPYTLLGAIYFSCGDRDKSNYYFEEAIKRGAKPEDIDDEIKRVFRNTKNEEQRHEAATYLLKKDLRRYAWAKSYLKNTQKS